MIYGLILVFGFNKFTNSIESLMESLRNYKKKIPNDWICKMAKLSNVIGYVYLKLNDYVKAKEFLMNH